MSWAEDQDWFGTEDLVLEAEEQALCGLERYNPVTDDYYDSEIEYISYPAWVMKDGTLIAIKDMQTSHIKNCIKMIHRRNNMWRHQYLRYFEAELHKRKLST